MSYDPFGRGRFPVSVCTVSAPDTARQRTFPVEVWYPATPRHIGQDTASGTQDVFTLSSDGAQRTQAAVRDAEARPGDHPLIVFSHASGHHRRGATFLCTHLSSHGYVVAAMDHSETVARELARQQGETPEQKAARIRAVIASRVPDVRFLIDHLVGGIPGQPSIRIDSGSIGIAGHSFGGWTALAAPEVEWRIRAVVALAPGGSSRPKPGILPGKLTFEWGRNVATLYLVAEDDIYLPIAGMHELFERTLGAKRMFILRRADHDHFMDHYEEEHEAARKLPWSGELAWIANEIRPITELCTGEQAHLFARGLAVAHFDATLRGNEEAERFLAGNAVAALAAQGVNASAAGEPAASTARR
jgi:dienelactone hydrolase